MTQARDDPLAGLNYDYYSSGVSTPLVRQRLVGRIIEWNDQCGFGWAEGYGQQRIFVHVSDLRPRQARPELGSQVDYVRGIDSQGRYCAKDVATFAIRRSVRRRGGWRNLALLGAALVLPGLALAQSPVAWWPGLGVLLGMSIAAVAAYAYDKKQAMDGGRRVAESTLHLIEFLGGWPGALLAQGWFRHKCSKASYQAAFWSIVLLYEILAIDVILSHRPSRWVGDTVLAWMGSI